MRRGRRTGREIVVAWLATLALELGVWATGADYRLLDGALYDAGGDVPAHRVSDDPFLHCELRPGAVYDGEGRAERSVRQGPPS